MRIVIKSIFFTVAILFGSLTQAAQWHDRQWKETGKATYTVLWFDIYTATLYVDGSQANLNENPNVALKLHYHRDIEAQELIESTEEQWQERQIADSEKRAAWLAFLRETWTDVKESDQITLTVFSDGHATFFKNDENIGSLKDEEFSRAMLAIWLAEPNPFPENRLALLGDYQCRILTCSP